MKEDIDFAEIKRLSSIKVALAGLGSLMVLTLFSFGSPFYWIALGLSMCSVTSILLLFAQTVAFSQDPLQERDVNSDHSN
jgi:hypothetical protein